MRKIIKGDFDSYTTDLLNDNFEEAAGTEVIDLLPPTAMDGSELVPAAQGPTGIKLTVDQLNSPAAAGMGFNGNRLRGFQSCGEITGQTSITTGGELIGSTGFKSYLTGAGAKLDNNLLLTFSGEVQLGGELGTTDAARGVGALSVHTHGWAGVNGEGRNADDRIAWKLNVLPSTGYTLRVGMIKNVAATDLPLSGADYSGAWFECDPGDGDTLWATIYNAGTEIIKVDTSYVIPAVSQTTVTRIFHDNLNNNIEFYINGELVYTYTGGGKPPTLSTYSGGFHMHKTSGTTNPLFVLFGHAYDYVMPTSFTGMF